ncbi:MAG: DUF4861 domain-containing protein [Massilibacteroides sp.]|nr:DUF4861 domain-containing protein [Massilibacteroides sp.]MDD3063394.1 DUF4861 domain-containing protein [Massilibacteroides sp.]MDD4115283.1 DUF4861 domain-containing protein [Massilibacteroides sp.]MDD4661151.1 DUF4861 domain-containing protein [Massilibacteroides sp.]
MKKLFSLFLCITLMSCIHKNKVIISVTNPSPFDRTNEIVELPFPVINLKMQGKCFFIADNDGKQIPYQITYDQKIIFPVHVSANKKTTYRIKEGKPQAYTPVVYGQRYPKRVDDIAWENDRIAFRTYGPALQATGEKAYGIDVWVKRVPELIVKERYRKELEEGISYHNDNGNGLDYYKVGPTLGAGTPALLSNDTLVYPYCYKTYQIVDNGPLRFTVKLTYNPLTIGQNNSIVEQRTISLDAGNQLNKITISYENLEKSLPVAVGIVLHDSGNEYKADQKNGYIAYADPADPQNGQTYLGAVFTAPLQEAKVVLFSEKEKAERGANGHVLGISEYKPGSEFTYYTGAGWSKWGFETSVDWFEYIQLFCEQIKQPLEIAYE